MATQPITEFSRITVEVQPPQARITLSHPPLNIMDVPMMEELAQALAEMEQRREVAVVVLAGSERAFSGGVEVAAHTADKIQNTFARFHAVIGALAGTRKVTIAAVRGHCLGGGAELAMMCDLVYTADSATWGFPEIKLGCYPPVAAAALAAVVGQKQAADLILTGRSIQGEKAAAIGLANRSLPGGGEVESAVAEAVSRLAKLSPAALAHAKKALYAWDSIHFDKGLARAEKIYLEELMRTEDAAEGLAAFMEKREPRWKGK